MRNGRANSRLRNDRVTTGYFQIAAVMRMINNNSELCWHEVLADSETMMLVQWQSGSVRRTLKQCE